MFYLNVLCVKRPPTVINIRFSFMDKLPTAVGDGQNSTRSHPAGARHPVVLQSGPVAFIAAANVQDLSMPRFAANLAYLFAERPFMERFGAAAAAGFQAVELQFPYDESPVAVKAELE